MRREGERGESGAFGNWCVIAAEQLFMLFREEGHAASGPHVHWRIEAGVLAAGAAFGWHLVIELVLDLYLVRFADLTEI